IGREREFSRLYDAWLEVRRRTPRIIVMVGDPGVGKTTLTNAFVSTCQMEGAAIARAQAYDAERELPFAVLAALITQLTLQRAIQRAAHRRGAECARLRFEHRGDADARGGAAPRDRGRAARGRTRGEGAA